MVFLVVHKIGLGRVERSEAAWQPDTGREALLLCVSSQMGDGENKTHYHLLSIYYVLGTV